VMPKKYAWLIMVTWEKTKIYARMYP
jgi:hypothetical protein